jgi:hypothetical protein
MRGANDLLAGHRLQRAHAFTTLQQGRCARVFGGNTHVFGRSCLDPGQIDLTGWLSFVRVGLQQIRWWRSSCRTWCWRSLDFHVRVLPGRPVGRYPSRVQRWGR